jgi:glucose/arabinose dehydrogenase
MASSGSPWSYRSAFRLVALIVAGASFLSDVRLAQAATLPTGFTETLVASGLVSPTAMQFAPDGRLFVAEQTGRLRVIKDGALLGTPFLTLTVDSQGERGLLGVAFDPAFATNRFVYVYYTATTPNVHNRISRFTANGDVVVPGSEVILFELDNLSSATNHNGGALAFGPDGKLYAAVGENAYGQNAQILTNVLGKMLRLNSDGSIPTDNPFYGTASGKNRAIWVMGLRNPFTFAFNEAGTQMFINDVGQNTWEEINDGIAGANYGWPTTEGTTTNPSFTSPRYSYNHSTTGVCAITGGAFYSPLSLRFPADYQNDYFFADFCAGWIRKLDWQNGNAVAGFATGISSPVDLKVSDDGSLYYLARGGGANTGVVYRIEYGTQGPGITQNPASQTVNEGARVTFSVRASGAGTLRYQWQRNEVNIGGASSPDYTIASVTSGDNGARFRAIVSNDADSVTSGSATLTVSANRAPTATIVNPVVGTLYSGGSVISYSGTGTDPEDGTLAGARFTWRVDFHHDTHSHPFIAETTGATGGQFTIPTTGETAANVWYRIYLTVRDSGGLTQTVTRDINPRKVNLTLATNPAGLQVTLDGQPVTTPSTVQGVVGIQRSLGVVSPQTTGGTTYTFTSWSDGGAATHTIATPASNTTYTATYQSSGSGGGGSNGLAVTYYNNADFTGTNVKRVDPTVDFDWAAGSPASAIGVEAFSARWTGQVLAPSTGTYTFYTQSDDGIRLWVNGQAIVDNWVAHSLTENSGTIALTAGQRYDIKIEYYENRGSAVARLLWSGPSMSKAVVPTGNLFSTTAPGGGTGVSIHINFQPGNVPVPANYLADAGLVYGNRGNGQTYGWTALNNQVMRDRNAKNSPDQRYDTFNSLQGAANPDAVWEIAVPNGTYNVHVVAGDPSYFDSVFRINVEGVLTITGTPNTATRWIEGTQTVTVSDGKLTVRSGAGASNNKVCFIDITQ